MSEEEKKIADLLDSLITAVIRLRMMKDEVAKEIDYLCNILMKYREYILEIKADELAKRNKVSEILEDKES